MKILVIEDDPIAQKVFALKLTGRGHLVETASTGAEGVAKADETFDIIFMDVGLTDYGSEGGARATKEIRAKGGFLAVIPIIALTANLENDIMVKMVEAGANDYLTKPADDAKVELLIADYTHRYPHAS